MTAETQAHLRRTERVALIIAAVAIIAAVILGLRQPDHVVPAWRFAIFACLQPALGSLIFILIHRLAGGRWVQGLAPFLVAGTRLLPWVWLLVLPLLAFPIAAQPYTPGAPHEDIQPLVTARASETTDAITALEHAFAPEPSRHFGETVRVYFSRPWIIGRSVFYGVVFVLLSLGASRVMRTQPVRTMRWFGPVGLIGLTFTLHLLAIDWFILLEPGWHSTGFPLVWMTGQGIAGLAAATCAAILSGANPGPNRDASRPRGLDWGNLLLASIMSWAYVAFVQLLIIWSGNLPSETNWYRHRSQGVWHGWVVALAILEFGAPFLLLLSRGLKKRRTGLASIAALLLLGQTGYTAWLIVPSFPVAAASGPWLPLALLAAAGALFLNRYLAGARSAAATLAP